jgi:uncharacterized membrane protein YidH (DUF202 family)
MEYKIGGVLLTLIGVFFIVFGNTRFGAPGESEQGGFVLPVWMDHAIKWAIGLVCVWFGVFLVFSHHVV